MNIQVVLHNSFMSINLIQTPTTWTKYFLILSNSLRYKLHEVIDPV
uniref:Uncharacterized protein n=1 Tax=Arundo donax TaxID=35708 RepID=A0A0A9EGN6_ARUDO